jgi:CRISPR-associated protein Cas2
MRLWIIAYDIGDDRRRRCLAQLLASRMVRVQESVFEGWLNGADVAQLLAAAAELLEPAADALRAYPLALRDPARRQTLGNQAGATAPAGYWIA